MKLRITGRSIRLRLSQSDVRQFKEHGEVSEELHLGDGPGNALMYRLTRGEAASATIENNRLIVTIAAAEADEWTGTDKVGIESMHRNSDGSDIHILIEKDFSCLTPRTGDDDKDTFPHPRSAETC
jgi:hypothetical protein